MSQQSEISFHRSLRTAGYDVTMASVTGTGGFLGRIAARFFVATLVEFADAVHGGSDLRQFVVMSTHGHVDRHRYLLSDVEAVDRSTSSRPRWYWRVMEHAFGLYCLMRRRAVPRQTQPVQAGGHWPRASGAASEAAGARCAFWCCSLCRAVA